MTHPQEHDLPSATAMRGRGPQLVSRNGDDTATAERFVRAFGEVWARPTADALVALCHPDVRLAAPLTKTTVGREAARAEFQRILSVWPDFRVEVDRWSATGDLVFIELTMMATIAGRLRRFPAVDRIVLRDGLVFERVTYSDSLPILTTMLRHPSAWPRWSRAR
jgi:ketosteroid isomerase-like protein